MHDGMLYGRNQGQGHSREVDRQSPTGLIFTLCASCGALFCNWSCLWVGGYEVWVGLLPR